MSVFGSVGVFPVGLPELESTPGPDGGTAEGLVDDGDFIVSDGPEGPAGPVGGVAGVIVGLVVEDVEAPGWLTLGSSCCAHAPSASAAAARTAAYLIEILLLVVGKVVEVVSASADRMPTWMKYLWAARLFPCSLYSQAQAYRFRLWDQPRRLLSAPQYPRCFSPGGIFPSHPG